VCHFESTDLVSKKSAGFSLQRRLKRRQPRLRLEPAQPKPTPRELEVEDLLCRGYSHENIAAIFGRSISTISVHVTSLYKKRGVHTQVGLLLAYLERKGIFVFGDEARGQSNGGSIPMAAMQ
jgi:DNA-binding NarL/FixJ family response regulator